MQATDWSSAVRASELVQEIFELVDGNMPRVDWSQLSLPLPEAQTILVQFLFDHYPQHSRPTRWPTGDIATWSSSALAFLALAHTIWPADASLEQTDEFSGPLIRDLLAQIEQLQLIPDLVSTDPDSWDWQQPESTEALLERWRRHFDWLNRLVVRWAHAEATEWLQTELETVTRHAVALWQMLQLTDQRQQKRLASSSLQTWLHQQWTAFFQTTPPLEFTMDWTRFINQQRLSLGLVYAYRQRDHLASDDTPLPTIVQNIVPTQAYSEWRCICSMSPRAIWEQTHELKCRDDPIVAHLATVVRDLLLLVAWSHLFFHEFQFFWANHYLVPASKLLEWKWQPRVMDGLRKARPCVTFFLGRWWVFVGSRFFVACERVDEALVAWIRAVLKRHGGKLETDQDLRPWLGINYDSVAARMETN